MVYTCCVHVACILSVVSFIVCLRIEYCLNMASLYKINVYVYTIRVCSNLLLPSCATVPRNCKLPLSVLAQLIHLIC